MNKNQDSLRWQIIDAMHDYAKAQGWADRTFDFNVQMFDEAIMPVLDAAMKAGELLLHRATTPQKPVPEAIIAWLEGCSYTIADLHRFEATVSKRELLDALYRFEESIAKALADSRALRPDTTEEAMGRLLAGNPLLPVKG